MNVAQQLHAIYAVRTNPLARLELKPGCSRDERNNISRENTLARYRAGAIALGGGEFTAKAIAEKIDSYQSSANSQLREYLKQGLVKRRLNPVREYGKRSEYLYEFI